MDAAPARVAVTGAAGFIGAALCRRLAADGHRVLGVSVDADGAACIEATGVEARRADITDPSATVAALAGSELVVHAAAKVSEWGPMAPFHRVNVEGTRNVLDASTGRAPCRGRCARSN